MYPKVNLRLRRFIVHNLVLGVVLVWELTARLVRSVFFPTPTEVVNAIITLIAVGDVEKISLITHVSSSISRVLSGFAVACITAVPLGLLMGLKREVYNSARILLESIRFVPPIAWIPLLIILLTGFSRYVAIIWIGAFFPILINTIAGVRRTNPTFVTVAKVFGADKKTTIYKVVIPSSLPEVVVGMRIGLGIAWMCIVAAEMLGGELTGLGRLIYKYARLLRVDMVLAGIILVGIIGFLMNEIFLRIERHLFRWRVEVTV